MKFSVVIPLFNKQNHIHRAVISVIAQTYTDFELIIVNDGSTDNSLEQAKQISDNRVRILTQANQGVSSARNTGIAEASNELIAFLDGDDAWQPTFLERMYGLYKSFPDCGIYASAYIIHDIDGTKQSPITMLGYPRNWAGIITDIYRDFRIFSPFNSSSVMVQKAELQSINGFPENVREGEDIVTWFRIFNNARVAYLNESLCTYYRNAENRACNKFEQRLSEYAPCTYLKNSLKDNAIPKELRTSAREYVNKHQLILAMRHIVQGDRKGALPLLAECVNTRIYRRKFARVIYHYLKSMAKN